MRMLLPTGIAGLQVHVTKAKTRRTDESMLTPEEFKTHVESFLIE